VRIRYDLDALATRGLSVEDIRLAVAALSSVAPIGSIRTQQQLYILEIKGAEPYAAYFRPAVVAWRNGAPVRLQDIAKVEDSVELFSASRSEDAMRRADVVSRSLAVDMLNRTLLSDFLPLQGARQLSFFLVGKIGPLRRALMREGVVPSFSQPRLMRGEAL
jgi:hypothetical protein